MNVYDLRCTYPQYMLIPTIPSANCQASEESLNCEKETLFKSYAGGDPGNKRDEKNHLIDEKLSELRVVSTSSVTSIFTDDRCAFSLRYMMNACIGNLSREEKQKQWGENVWKL
ncbi:unnamed protein product, partial [Mesorhabditis belari]|uniref:Uncharacterized protein n=1 Tax=Mesorhabditis belari TaxID=2138241 RepID=A0AAF3ELW0_9BILA